MISMADLTPKQPDDFDHVLGGIKDFWKYWAKKRKDKRSDQREDFWEMVFAYGWHNIVYVAAQCLLAMFLWFILFQRLRLIEIAYAIALWFIGKYLFQRWTGK